MAYLFRSSLLLMLLTGSAVQAQKGTHTLGDSDVLRGAAISAVAIDAITGEVLDAFRPDERLCPASVWKVFTTAAAIELLGPDFRFRTALGYQGTIKDKVLHGDLVVVGGGDPSLGSARVGEGMEALLASWVKAIRAAGIDSVTGAVVANAAHFQGDGIPRTRIWEDMANYYGASVSGLNAHDNAYFVDYTTPREPGLPARVKAVRPAVPGLVLHSEVLASEVQRDMAYIFGAPGSLQRTVRGTLPAGRDLFTIKGSLPDPPLFLAFHLHLALSGAGIPVLGGYVAEKQEFREPATVKQILDHASPPLAFLVRHTLVESDNLFAETLLYQLGARHGEPSLEGGLKVINAHYQHLSGDGKPFFAYDGSGLSRYNSVSASVVARLLLRIRNNDALREGVLMAMPMAGKEGTVKYLARNTNLDGNMRAKSGSMDKVKAYAGNFTAYTGREVSYAVLINNFDASSTEVRKAVEKWFNELYGNY